MGDVVEPTAEEIPVVIEPRVWSVGGTFAGLDVVNISEVFDRRPKLMQTVPFMLRGVFRSAMKLTLQEIWTAPRRRVSSERPEDGNSFCCFPECFIQTRTRRPRSPKAVRGTVQVIPRRSLDQSWSTRVQFHRRRLTHS